MLVSVNSFGRVGKRNDALRMRWLFHPLLMLVVSSTECELAQQIEFLKAENQMLRKRVPKPIRFTHEEKRLMVRSPVQQSHMAFTNGRSRAGGRCEDRSHWRGRLGCRAWSIASAAFRNQTPMILILITSIGASDSMV